MTLLKKYWFVALPVFLLCLPLIMVVYTMSSYGYSWEESVEVVRATGKNNTKFQETRYEERNFKKIEPGDTGRTVFELLGVPLERLNDDTLWRYTTNVGSTGYFHERALVMKKGVVQEVINRFARPEPKKK
jgi:hypothetical protein